MDDAILFMPLIGLCTIFVIVLIIQTLKNKRNNKERTVQAKVQTKKIKRAYSRALANAGISGVDWYEYYAVFQPEEGKKLELQLPKEIYDSIEENDKGQLTFKGYNFVSFDKDSCFFVQSSQ